MLWQIIFKFLSLTESPVIRRLRQIHLLEFLPLKLSFRLSTLWHFRPSLSHEFIISSFSVNGYMAVEAYSLKIRGVSDLNSNGLNEES